MEGAAADDGSTEARSRVRDVFDDWARRGRAEGMEHGHAYAARIAFERLRLAPGTNYLDVGCGNGYSVRWAARAVGSAGSAFGIDLAPQMIAVARQASQGIANVQFHVAAFPDHPLPPASFRGIFSMEALYYLPDLGEALAEIRRLLEPGGRLACVVDYYEENEASHGWPADLDCAMTRLDMAGWRRAFEDAGLALVEQACIRYPFEPGCEPDWKQTQGSLLTVGER